MKILLLLFLLLTSMTSGAQNEDFRIRFAVTCGAGAQTSNEIAAYKQLNEQKDYKSIREKLFTGNPLEQVLSVILLKYYSSTAVIELTKQEFKKIEQITKSKERFSLCFTCTFAEEGTIKQLFANKKEATYYLVKGTMLNIL
jgi:hypothetical protein